MKSIDDAVSMLRSVDSQGLLHEFDTYIEPLFVRIGLEYDLQKKVNLCSYLQHKLFRQFVKRVNTADHFAAAYWRIADLNLPIAREIDFCLDKKFPVRLNLEKLNLQKTLWIIKGPFDLAHMDCVKNFLYGESIFKKNVGGICDDSSSQNILCFLDIPVPLELKNSSNVFSLETKQTNTFLKLYRLREYIYCSGVRTIIWPSVFQDHSLYMGVRHAEQQIFWSAKHRIQVLPRTIDQYFFGGFSKHSEIFRGVEWKYGRSDLTSWRGLKRLNIEHSALSNDSLIPSNLKSIKNNFQFILGSCCVEEKYTSAAFWEAINHILCKFPQAAYCFTGQSVLPEVESIIGQLECRDRLFFVGWQKNIDIYVSLLDVYLDAFPFGSGHVLFNSWMRSIPTVSLSTFENTRLSLLHSLQYIDSIFDGDRFLLPGIAYSVEDYIQIAAQCIDNKDFRLSVSSAQSKVARKYMSNPVGLYEDFNSYITQTFP